MQGIQRPLELILARNLLASVSTPAFLVDARGVIAFYNDAAGALLGRRYEDTGPLSAEEWTNAFGPFDGGGIAIGWDRLNITQALRGNRAAHDRFWLRFADGDLHMVELSALPIMGAAGFRGAMVFWWPAQGGEGG